jgi:hypothetical protein
LAAQMLSNREASVLEFQAVCRIRSQFVTLENW